MQPTTRGLFSTLLNEKMIPVNTYSDYNAFAWVYNKHWGDSFTQIALPVIENLVLRQLPAQASILDLCCGTGQLAQTLIALGYRVTGIDGSEEMLRFARENAPAAEFIQADARSFKLPEVYHAVVSTFDSLNHVMTLEELTSVFRSVYDALRENGLFLFDLNMEEGYRIGWDGSFGIVEEDHVCVFLNSHRPDERTAQFDATIFRLQGTAWQRSDVMLLQKYYSEAEVRSALEVAGFTEIRAYAHDEQSGFKELTADSERAFFVCQKPADANSGK